MFIKKLNYDDGQDRRAPLGSIEWLSDEHEARLVVFYCRISLYCCLKDLKSSKESYTTQTLEGLGKLYGVGLY